MDESHDHFISRSPSSSFSSYSANNITQFNVTESIHSLVPQQSLHVDSENLTLEIPENWNYNWATMDIAGFYKPWEILRDNDISNPIGFWEYETNIPIIDPNTFALVGDSSGGVLGFEGRGNKISPYFDGDFACWSQEISLPDSNLMIYETDLIREGSNQYPLQEDFSLNPNWEPLTDFPYGGTNGTSTSLTEYDSNSESLSTYIKAGSSEFSLGNPSVGWHSNFTNPSSSSFFPNRIELTISWCVENLNYEAQDNLSIIVRIDDNYLNGTIDANGNTFFANATSTTIENSINNGAFLNHGFITRTYDITELIDLSVQFHTIDFGIWLENIDETNDEIRVQFADIEIKAIENDQYNIGELNFTCELNIDDPKEEYLWDHWQLYYSFSNTTKEDFHRIGYLSDYFSSLTEVQTFELNLTSHSQALLNEPSATFSIGLVSSLDNSTIAKNAFQLTFDDLSLSPIYHTSDYGNAQLKIYNGTGFELLQDPTFDFLETVHNNLINASFQVLNSNYSDSTLAFTCDLYVDRDSENMASADFYVDSTDLTNGNEVHWNVSLNNSLTFSQIGQNQHENFNLTHYNFTVIDLPAWDSLGMNSNDWDYIGSIDPLQAIPFYSSHLRTNGTSDCGTSQNITIINATGWDAGFINGTWTLEFLSQNYVSDIALKHNSIPISKVYYLNSTQIEVNQTIPSNICGSYETRIQNSTGDLVATFPIYNSSITGNLTLNWVVPNLLPGEYDIISFWNSSNGEVGNVTRVGFLTYTFEVWRQTDADLLTIPETLQPAQKGEFYFNVTDSMGNLLSDVEPYVSLYCLNTSNDWGLAWSPYQYLVSDIFENLTDYSQGNYTLEFQTRYVPDGTYDVAIILDKPYYDPQYLYSIINITGSVMEVEIITGGYNLNSTHGLLNSDNIPYLNDTDHTKISLYLDDSGNQPLENGIISGSFNGTDLSFMGTDIFQITQYEEDRGKYDLFFDTTGLDATNPIEGKFNYSLIVSISVSGYSSISINISTSILPVPTALSLSTLDPVYEGEIFELFATYANTLHSPHVPLLDATLSWQLQNGSNPILMSGSLEQVFPGFYKLSDVLTAQIYPGIYELLINATKENCAFSSESVLNFEIVSKIPTIIEISVINAGALQIKSYLDVEIDLTYENGTALSNKEILIDLEFGEEDTISVIEYTDEEGTAFYSKLIDSVYANLNLTITALYEGDSFTKNTTTIVDNIFIMGMSPVNLTITPLTSIQVGYFPSFSLSMMIEDRSDYSGLSLTLTAWYNELSNDYILIQNIVMDSDGIVSFEFLQIGSGFENLSIRIEFAGTTILNYSTAEETFIIESKWATNVSFTDIPSEIRPGYYFDYNITAQFLNASCPESFFLLPIEISYFYSTFQTTMYSYFDENGTISSHFLVPEEAVSGFNISLQFSGTEKLANAYTDLNYTNVLPKWELNFKFEVISEFFQIGYEAEILITASFTNNSCPELLYGKLIRIDLSYNGYSESFDRYFDEQNQTTYSVLIPEIETHKLNLTAAFTGTSQISPHENSQSFEIDPKWELDLEMEVISEYFQIGYEGEILITASFINNSCPELLYGKSIRIDLFYNGYSESFDLYFDEQNQTVFSLLIPEVNNHNLTLTAAFTGTSQISPYENSQSFEIDPKWDLDLELEVISEYFQVGYEAEILITASYTNISCPESFYGKNIYIYISYGGPIESYELYFNELNQTILKFLITQKELNILNITVDFVETSRISTFGKSQSFEITPKWSPTLEILSEQTTIRMGGTIDFTLIATISNSQFTENALLNFPLIFIARYDGFIIITNYTLDNNGKTSFSFEVPIIDGTSVNFSIEFLGSTKIEPTYHSLSLEILPQKATHILILSHLPLSGLKGKGLSVQVQLKSTEDNLSLSDQRIEFYLKDDSGIISIDSRLTDENGIVELILTIIDSGDYTLEYSYFGESIYSESNSPISFPIDIQTPFEFYFLKNLLPILIIVASVSISVAGYYKFVQKPKKRKMVADIFEIRLKFSDLENLQHLFIIKKDTGLSLFSHAFTDIPIEENLISGFLSAISSFGVELRTGVRLEETDSEDSSGLEELTYNKFKIVIIEGEITRIALLLLKAPSESLKKKVKSFVSDFERTHGDFLVKWSGELPTKEPIMASLEKFLFINVAYNHKIIMTRLPQYQKKLKQRSTSALILKECISTFNNLFTVSDLMDQMLARGKGEVETFNIFVNLVANGLIIPISPLTEILVQEFLPLIDPIPKDERIALKQIYNGYTDYVKLSEITNIPVIVRTLHNLQKKGFLTESNELTDLGSKITTILNIVDD